MRVAYLVHNLGDAAVAKRVAMLEAAGATVSVIGFCRDGLAPARIGTAPTVSLGQTFDANLRQRVKSVLRNVIRLPFWRRHVMGSDVIIARNLEMLLLGAIAARASGVSRLVYESLDIHRSLLGDGVANRILRSLERTLARRCSLLIYSSPAFWRNYFAPVQRIAIDRELVENRVLDLSGTHAPRASIMPPAGPPWTIGWFGNLRCRRTLKRLRSLADLGQGAIRILIAGKPSQAEFPDFAAQVAHPSIEFVGRYTVEDLPALYGRCHFAWSIDYFEEGQNSRWLLPNRIYEAAVHGSVPIALESVETGRWLAGHEAGLRISENVTDDELTCMLKRLSQPDFAALHEAVVRIPIASLVAGREDCIALARRIGGI